jgi:hypothetical protein
MEHEGIFRVSCDRSQVDNLKQEIDKGEKVNMSKITDAHVVASLIKQYFRDLPSPLLSKDFFEQWTSVAGLDVAKGTT